MSPLIQHSLNVLQLIEGCLLGKRSAQEELFRLYAGKMMTLCRRYSTNTQEAEDNLQDGFIKVFSNLKNFSNEGSFEGWLRRIFINSCLRNIEKKHFKNELVSLDSISQEKSPYPDVLTQLSVEQIISLIQQLPEGYKTVFNLYAIEGYSHKEIAALLSIQEVTSRSQMMKARRMLQSMFVESQKMAI